MAGFRVRRCWLALLAAGGIVVDLELKANGSHAWIETGPPVVGQFPAVWAVDGFGQRRLDSGNVSLKSLILSGSTLTLRKDGVMHSATLY